MAPSDARTDIEADEPSALTERAARLLLWMVAGLVAAAAAAIALPHDPYLRYQQLSDTIHHRVQWSYERIHFDPTPIDVAVIGNSRLGAGVNAPALGRELSKRLGRTIHVVNLSTPQEGRNMHWVMARELLETRPETSLVVMSLTETGPRRTHPAFRNLATASDVLTTPALINFDWLNDVAYLPYRQISLAIQSLAPGLFGLKTAFDPSTYSGPDLDTTGTITLPGGQVLEREVAPPEPELRAAAKKRIAGASPQMLPDWAADYEFVVERAYTRRIARLAAATDTALAFLYLPIYTDHGGVDELGFYEAKGEIYLANQLIDAAALYHDYGHLNRAGADELTRWLAARIADDVDSGAIHLGREAK
ncbi:hypothetical protein G5B40_16000 [Pikeienuella piscinae]|uniref:Uncharacterized protein n=1 Tax=Pikeienuella piscinae TaxID=2748098 RepID=A0A7L5C2M9_9RHOB|nr:hypothetical protein [Pikeienuella piscinae]QIE56806.1 hypothetical protein G5B40_16000 [Pikeienuella piscinae]